MCQPQSNQDLTSPGVSSPWGLEQTTQLVVTKWTRPPMTLSGSVNHREKSGLEPMSCSPDLHMKRKSVLDKIDVLPMVVLAIIEPHMWLFSVKIILIRPSSIQYADSDIGLSIQSISRNVRSHSRLSTIFIVSYQCWPRADLSVLMGSSAPTADGPAIRTERGSWKCFHDRHQSKLDVSATCGPCLGGFLIGVRLPLFSKDAAPVNLTRYFSIHLLHPQRLFHRVCDDASRFFSTRVTHAAAVWKIAVNYQWSRK